MLEDSLRDPFKYSIGTRIRDNLFLEMMRPKNTDVILDLGCGLGHFTDLLTRNSSTGYSIGATIGIDIDETCINFCRENLKGIYIEGNVLDIPFVNETFDKILCTEVIEHIQNTHEILGEANRVLKKGGVLVASVPCSEGMFGATIKNIGHDHVDQRSLEYHHHKGFSLEGFTQLLKQNGFTVKRHEYTLVCMSELIMGATKIFCHAVLRQKISSQANAVPMSKKWFWKPYCAVFPALLWIGKAEQPLSRKLKGHMLIVKAIKE